MLFHLPALPYEPSAFEGIFSEETFDFHHGKHLKSYVDNLNKLIEDSPLKNSPLEEIIKNAKGPLFNNAAQCWNHTFYFHCITPNKKDHLISTKLNAAIESYFGSKKNFLEEFLRQGLSNFGSGWTWLVKSEQGVLSILNSANADNPITANLKPLLTMDVWEHAYYIDYRNNRKAYLEAAFKVIDWEFVSNCYESDSIFNVTKLMQNN